MWGNDEYAWAIRGYQMSAVGLDLSEEDLQYPQKTQTHRIVDNSMLCSVG